MPSGVFLGWASAGLLGLASALFEPPPRADEPMPGRDDEAAETAAPTRAEMESATGNDALPIAVEVRNEMGKSFKLVEARVTIDGVEVVRRAASEGRELEDSFKAFSGVVVGPGPHALNSVLVYEGRKRGPITYLENYKFRVTSDFTFGNGDAGKGRVIEIVGKERQGMDVPLEDRPVVVVQLAPKAVLPAVTNAKDRVPTAAPSSP
jgi:hypothetical protein